MSRGRLVNVTEWSSDSDICVRKQNSERLLYTYYNAQYYYCYNYVLRAVGKLTLDRGRIEPTTAAEIIRTFVTVTGWRGPGIRIKSVTRILFPQRRAEFKGNINVVKVPMRSTTSRITTMGIRGQSWCANVQRQVMENRYRSENIVRTETTEYVRILFVRIL